MPFPQRGFIPLEGSHSSTAVPRHRDRCPHAVARRSMLCRIRYRRRLGSYTTEVGQSPRHFRTECSRRRRLLERDSNQGPLPECTDVAPAHRDSASREVGTEVLTTSKRRCPGRTRRSLSSRHEGGREDDRERVCSRIRRPPISTTSADPTGTAEADRSSRPPRQEAESHPSPKSRGGWSTRSRCP